MDEKKLTYILNRVEDISHCCSEVMLEDQMPMAVIQSMGEINPDHVINIVIDPRKLRFEQRCDSKGVYEAVEVELYCTSIGMITKMATAMYHQTIGEIYEIAKVTGGDRHSD